MKILINICVIIIFIIASINYTTAQESPLLTIKPLDDELEYMNRVEISPNGSKILTGGYTPALWDSETGELLKTFPTTYEQIIAKSLSFSKDGKLVLIGEDPFSAKLWNVESGEHIHTFQSFTFNNPDISNPTLGGISAADFSQDGNLLLTGDINGAVQLWDMNTFEEIQRYQQLSSIAKISFLPNENQFLVQESGIVIFELETGEITKRIRLSSPSLTQDNQKLLGLKMPLQSLPPKIFQLWDLVELTQLSEFEVPTSFDPPFYPTISPKADWIMVLNSNQDSLESTREVFKIDTLEKIYSKSATESEDKNAPSSSAFQMKFFPEGDRYLTVHGNTVHIWSTANFSTKITNSDDY